MNALLLRNVRRHVWKGWGRIQNLVEDDARFAGESTHFSLEKAAEETDISNGSQMGTELR